ncbi:tumor necrosis factor receptor superfamily member 12A isoform X1 [Hippocampus comes]|uniref:tumor necrosis factor receptor superfamily member 12A isoform X1 n=1 Tax=Hippocampus comes TaxID=109280 RepID=UPI00094EAC4A|nr:PREDICTED: tumor necrosis factor receptor superfamily member 12A isoform X1 [Hippocampus comes]XP_019749369.1 PREDICTED: tumor necrosis factor receptor superfamily member 12A isoform X1 [Hippocampus comes]
MKPSLTAARGHLAHLDISCCSARPRPFYDKMQHPHTQNDETPQRQECESRRQIAHERSAKCGLSEFWNSDLDACVPCASCKQYPKTPSCNTCKLVEETSDVWKLAAISSFSVLAVVLVGAALIIGVMVHRRKSHKLPLREPIEETAGPLYQA